MRRIEGFIDLDELFSKNNIDINKIEKLEKININGNLYFFKIPEFTSPYSELLGEELLKNFNLVTAEYDLAIFKGQKGVISKNTHEDGINYISGRKLIDNYQESIEKSEYLNINVSNSLETLWNALDYRYKYNPNKEKIIFHLMDKIVQMFIFDILTSQFDRHGDNYEIMESDSFIDLAPIYDNEGIVHIKTYENISLLVDEDYKYNNDLFYQLNKFIRYGDSSYLDRIKEKMWVISKDNLEKAFSKIERKTKYHIDNNIKEYYLERFNIHREKLKEIINNYDTREVIK